MFCKPTAIHSATFDIFEWLSVTMLRVYFGVRRWTTDFSGSEKASLGLGLQVSKDKYGTLIHSLTLASISLHLSAVLVP